MQIASVYRPKLTESNDYLKYLWKYWSPSYNTSKEEIDEIRNAFTKDNVVDAVTSYYRHLFRPFSLVKSRWPVDFNRVPTLILVGKEDGCMSPRIAELEKVERLPQSRSQDSSKCWSFLTKRTARNCC